MASDNDQQPPSTLDSNTHTEMVVRRLILLCPGHFCLEHSDFILNGIGHDDVSSKSVLLLGNQWQQQAAAEPRGCMELEMIVWSMRITLFPLLHGQSTVNSFSGCRLFDRRVLRCCFLLFSRHQSCARSSRDFASGCEDIPVPTVRRRETRGLLKI